MNKQIATIADGETVSSSVLMDQHRFVVFRIPSTFNGTSITIKSQDYPAGTDWVTKIHDGTTASAITFAVTADEAYVPVGDIATALAALHEFTITSDAAQSGADCDIVVEFK